MIRLDIDGMEAAYRTQLDREDQRLQQQRRHLPDIAEEAAQRLSARQAVAADKHFLRRLERRRVHRDQEG